MKKDAHVGDRAFAASLTMLGGVVLLVLGVIVWSCFGLSRPAISKIGYWQFLTGSDWNPVTGLTLPRVF